MGYPPSSMNQDGWVYSNYRRAYETNQDFLARFSDKYFNNSLSVDLTAGDDDPGVYYKIHGYRYTGFVADE